VGACHKNDGPGGVEEEQDEGEDEVIDLADEI
jgi:hypothetical protein